MRKGFILTLTTVALTLMVTSAVAIGPTVSNVPDVWITEEGDTDNVFRYSDALLLLDYIIPGVPGTERSSSDTLYWTYALKDVTLSGSRYVGTGAYLPAGPGQHYQINTFGAVTPTLDPSADIDLWAGEINPLAVASETLADADRLDFYNIRLNLDALNPVPNPPSGLPDRQEATLYVTDGTDIPSTDTIIITTIDNDTQPDYLTKTETECDKVAAYQGQILASEDPWNEFALLVNWAPNPANDPLGIDRVRAASVYFQPLAVDKSTTSVAVTTPHYQIVDRNGRQAGLLVLVAPALVELAQRDHLSIPGQKNAAYRFKATLESDNDESSSNTMVLLTLNGRNSIGASFGGFRQAGPDNASAAMCATTYLVPTATGDVLPALMMYDDSASQGGMITASDFRIDSFPLGNMATGTVQASSGVGVADHTVGIASAPGVWTGFALDSNGVDMGVVPEVTSGPDQTASVLQITATSPDVVAAPNAMAIFGFDGQFTTTANSLLVVKAMVNTSAADDAQIPTLRLTTLQRVGGPTDYTTFMINDFMLDRTLGYNTVDGVGTVDSDVSTTLDDYYVIGETAGATLLHNVWFAGLANQAGQTWNGDLRLDSVEVSEHPLPDCGCD